MEGSIRLYAQLRSVLSAMTVFDSARLLRRHSFQSRARPRQESILPDPTSSLGYASNANPPPGAGLGTQPTTNIGFSFAQEFPYPGNSRRATSF